MPLLARLLVPLKIRTCGFPAYGSPVVFFAWLRCLRISDGAPQPVQALVPEESIRPLAGFPCVEIALKGGNKPSASHAALAYAGAA